MMCYYLNVHFQGQRVKQNFNNNGFVSFTRTVPVLRDLKTLFKVNFYVIFTLNQNIKLLQVQ